jgi:hypothetical protein
VIRSYGLHWAADKIFWGRPGVAGTLMGAASRSKRARPVDFRNQRGIYALYADYEVVYLGQTGAGNDSVNRRRILTPDRRAILTPYSRCLKRQDSLPVSTISQ